MGLSHEPTSISREALGRFLRWHLDSVGHQNELVISAIGGTGEGGNNSRPVYLPFLNEIP